jgi:hypothetical protein
MTALDFYNKNKNCKWDMKPLPTFDNIEEAARWILLNGFAWIELDVEINIDLLKEESKYCTNYLVPHREGDNHLDWKSCCIHGIDVDKTGIWNKYVSTELDANYHWTNLSDTVRYTTEFWKSLPFEKYARVRYMQVGAMGHVSPHADFDISLLKDSNFDIFNNIIPINLAIYHPDDCFMTLNDLGIVPWRDGKIIFVNISNTHSVINLSQLPRLHMIGHGIPGIRKKEFCELLVRSYNKQYERYKL